MKVAVITEHYEYEDGSMIESVHKTKKLAIEHCRGDGFKYNRSSKVFYKTNERWNDTIRYIDIHDVSASNRSIGGK